MMVKRLLCIVGSMNAGGAETFLMKIYREIDKSKYQMDFAVADANEGFYDKEIISMGGKIHHITPKSKGVFENFGDIRRLVRREGYKYVLRTSQHSLSALELLAAKLGGAKVRVFRSSNSNTTTGSKKQLLLHNLCMFMPRFFANVRIAPSTEAAEYMFGKGCIESGNALLVNNGVDTSVYKYSEIGKTKTRHELGIDIQNFVVGHIGRFNQQKNHKFLVDVFKEIRMINSKAILLLVGTGELQDSIKQEVVQLGLKDCVVFAGVREDIPEILSAMDVFVFPSLYEGMPNTVIEAQATGLPCIISDTITKEANITRLVEYVSLEKSPREWAEMALKIQTCREPQNIEFDKMGYSIKSVAEKFVNCVFEGCTSANEK